MREDELRALANCGSCGKGIGHTGLPLFYRVTIERFGLDMKALSRQQGLTMVLGGHAALARVMGPDEELAKPVMEKVVMSLCETCGMDSKPIGLLAEFGRAEQEAKAEVAP